MLRLPRRKNTHDPEEVLSTSDRIAVMNEGGIDQIGTPQLVPHSQGDPVPVYLPQDALRRLAASDGAVTAAPRTAEASEG